jgi:hypothetical protein
MYTDSTIDKIGGALIEARKRVRLNEGQER